MSLPRALGLVLAVCGALFVLAWAATPLPDGLRIGAIDLLWFSSAFFAGIACLWARGRPENAALRRSFACFAAGSLFWASGQAVWTYQELVQEIDSPVFSLADIGFWVSLPFLALGIILWPRERRPWGLEHALDFVLVAGFATLFGIELVLAPLLALEVGGLTTLYAVVYPPSEILLFGSILAVFTLSGWRERARIELIAFALLVLCVADSGYTYLGDAYSTGGLLDPLWTLGFVGIGLAAVAPAEWRSGRGWLSDRTRVLAPTAALVLLAVIGVVFGTADGTHAQLRFFALLALVGVLAVRQGYAQMLLAAQIDEQRRLEQQLQHAQKLEAVGRLAGGIAHDFNNLLTAIDGYSELALHQLDREHPVRHDIGEVRRAAQRASELTRQLLAFSRRQVLAPQVVDLNDVVRESQNMLRRLVGGDVRLSSSLDRARAFVRADPGQLEQVITNLVLNARDAMTNGGTIQVTTLVSGETVRLSVADSGVGMDGDTQARLFEPFFTTKEPGKGTGLGLAMVHGIVTQSGGTIDVESAVGRGSRFDIEFPRAAESELEPGRNEPDGRGRGAETVLLVEDEPLVRDLARRMLELEGYSVATAESGDEALQAFGAHEVDVLVTDIVMPGLSGQELAASLRESRPELPVVLMSGFAHDSEPLDGLLSAGAAFVEKPFTADTLASAVRGVLD